MSGEGTGLKHGPWELAEERADSEGRTQREHVSYRKVATGWYTLQCAVPLGLASGEAEGQSARQQGGSQLLLPEQRCRN